MRKGGHWIRSEAKVQLQWSLVEAFIWPWSRIPHTNDAMQHGYHAQTAAYIHG